jgi:hypothetical protein
MLPQYYCIKSSIPNLGFFQPTLDEKPALTGNRHQEILAIAAEESWLFGGAAVWL